MIEIRPGVTDDALVIAGFQRAMALETEDKILLPEIVETAVSQVLLDPGKGFYLVAESAGAVCGCLMITYEWSDWRNTNVWYIQSVYVSPEFRGQGVFKALFHAVSERANAAGTQYIRLYVETENHRAQKIYESLGMKRMPYYMYDLTLDAAPPHA